MLLMDKVSDSQWSAAWVVIDGPKIRWATSWRNPGFVSGGAGAPSGGSDDPTDRHQITSRSAHCWTRAPSRTHCDQRDHLEVFLDSRQGPGRQDLHFGVLAPLGLGLVQTARWGRKRTSSRSRSNGSRRTPWRFARSSESGPTSCQPGPSSSGSEAITAPPRQRGSPSR